MYIRYPTFHSVLRVRLRSAEAQQGGMVAANGLKSYAQGPSARSVISLSDPGRPMQSNDEILPMKGPPLQRATRRYYKLTDDVQDEDCLASHVRQLQMREDELKANRRADRRAHRADMRELRSQFDASFEEIAARRAWHSQVAGQQLQQAREQEAVRLATYKEANTMEEFWPYEKGDRRRKALPPKSDYGKELLTQAAQQKRKAMVQKMMLNAAPPAAASAPAPKLSRGGSINTLIDPLPAAFTASSSSAATGTEPPVPAIIAKRKAVQAQAQARLEAEGSPIDPRAMPQSYFAVDVQPFEDAEYARALHAERSK